MNEQFLELARRAGLKFSSDTALSPPELKFAELIVRECVVMTKGYEFALGRKDELSKTMREHFGVK